MLTDYNGDRRQKGRLSNGLLPFSKRKAKALLIKAVAGLLYGRDRSKGMRMLPASAVIFALLAASCSLIDCPLNSLVYTQYQLMTAAGTADTLADTLTISTNRMDGSDSVLINKNVRTTEFSLPISYTQPQDVFYFELKDTLYKTVVKDTVTVAKTDKMHFESADCSPSYYHKITSVGCTHNSIDSIVLINPDVNYDTSKKHFRIYFKPRP